jgi:large subunit ribosomal protein L19
MNILQKIEHDNMQKLAVGKRLDTFSQGDSVRVNVRIIEGNTERVQAFEGVVIAIKNAGQRSAFTVRKISHGEGVERVFPLYSPRVDSVELIRKGTVRRAKLYYLRGLTGKAARIVEKKDAVKKDAAE